MVGKDQRLSTQVLRTLNGIDNQQINPTACQTWHARQVSITESYPFVGSSKLQYFCDGAEISSLVRSESISLLHIHINDTVGVGSGDG